VDRGSWLAARVLVLLTLALAYYIALTPMMLVYVAHVGMPFLLARLVIWTPGILLVSVAVGTLIGVFFIGRSVAPPIATGSEPCLAAPKKRARVMGSGDGFEIRNSLEAP
jgi:hypothetical protein